MAFAAAAVAAAGEDPADGRIALVSLESRVRDEQVVLDAEVEYHFSGAAIEALKNGVPLTLDHRVELRPAKGWWWRPALRAWRFDYRIQYHTLGTQYQVENVQTRRKQGFATLEAAIKELGTLDALPLMPAAELPPGEALEFRLRVALDPDALPLPLRPVAYISPAWDLESDWKSCPLPR